MYHEILNIIFHHLEENEELSKDLFRLQEKGKDGNFQFSHYSTL